MIFIKPDIPNPLPVLPKVEPKPVVLLLPKRDPPVLPVLKVDPRVDPNVLPVPNPVPNPVVPLFPNSPPSVVVPGDEMIEFCMKYLSSYVGD